MTTIGERIAGCRREKNFSQEYLAQMLDVSRQAVSKWENDITEPDTGNLIKLSSLLGVSVEYLACGTESDGESAKSDSGQAMANGAEGEAAGASNGVLKQMKGRFSFPIKITIERLFIFALSLCLVASIVIIGLLIKGEDAVQEDEKPWFPIEKLSEYGLTDMPMPEKADCIGYSDEKVLLNFSLPYATEDWNDYLEALYKYLSQKGFAYLGTRGDVITSDGVSTAYELKPAYELGDFSLYDVDDYYFVFTNSDPTVSGKVEAIIIAFDTVTGSKLEVGGEEYEYDHVMSVYSSSERESYSIFTHSITYDSASLYLLSNPTAAMPGVKVRIRTNPILDAELFLYVNGKMIPKVYSESDYWEYLFVMPEENVHITHIISGGGPVEPRETFLHEFEPWLLELAAEDIAEVRTVSEYLGTPPGALKTVKSTQAPEEIEAILKAFSKVTIKDVPKEEAEIEGGGAYSVEFTLKDGSKKPIRLHGGIYRYGYEQEELSVLCYFELSEIPELQSKDGVNTSYSFVTYSDTVTVYSHINGERAELGKLDLLSEIEFEIIDYDGQFNLEDYIYTAESDVGVLFIYDDKHFCLGQSTPDFNKCYALTNTGFDAILGASDPKNNLNSEK